MTPAAPTDVAPISDAELAQLRYDLKRRGTTTTGGSVLAAVVDSLLARLDEAETENEHLIQQTVRFIELEVERDQLAALNDELVKGLEELARNCGATARAFRKYDFLEAAIMAADIRVDQVRALLAKARPQEPAPCQ